MNRDHSVIIKRGRRKKKRGSGEEVATARLSKGASGRIEKKYLRFSSNGVTGGEG